MVPSLAMMIVLILVVVCTVCGAEESQALRVKNYPPETRIMEQLGSSEKINNGDDTDADNENGILDLRFSLWHSAFNISELASSHEDVVETVLSATREVLCEDTNFSIVSRGANSDETEDLCSDPSTRKNRQLQSPQEKNVITQSPNSVLSQWTSVEMSNQKASVTLETNERKDLLWTEWRVTYSIYSVGHEYLSQASLQLTDQTTTLDELINEGEQVMDNVAQLALDVRIMEGIMNERLQPVGAVMSLVNFELQTFIPIAFGNIKTRAESTNATDVEQLHLSGSNVRQRIATHFLRSLGATLFLINTLAVIFLTWLARRRRLARQQATQKIENARETGLVTEKGVDFMLDQGRKQSMQILRQQQQSQSRTVPVGGAGPECWARNHPSALGDDCESCQAEEISDGDGPNIVKTLQEQEQSAPASRNSDKATRKNGQHRPVSLSSHQGEKVAALRVDKMLQEGRRQAQRLRKEQQRQTSQEYPTHRGKKTPGGSRQSQQPQPRQSHRQRPRKNEPVVLRPIEFPVPCALSSNVSNLSHNTKASMIPNDNNPSQIDVELHI